jgi:hypothetical protein
MEVLEHEEEEDLHVMEQDEEELVSIPKEWCERLADDMKIDELPGDMYILPEMKEPFPEKKSEDGRARDTRCMQEDTKGKWGPTLVDKRPSGFQRDDRTMLEKAQERKKIINMEKTKGITKTLNSFSVLAAEEIWSLAKVVGISLGVDQGVESKSMLDIMESDRARISTLSESYSQCKNVGESLGENAVERGGGQLTPYHP